MTDYVIEAALLSPQLLIAQDQLFSLSLFSSPPPPSSDQSSSLSPSGGRRQSETTASVIPSPLPMQRVCPTEVQPFFPPLPHTSSVFFQRLVLSTLVPSHRMVVSLYVLIFSLTGDSLMIACLAYHCKRGIASLLPPSASPHKHAREREPPPTQSDSDTEDLPL